MRDGTECDGDADGVVHELHDDTSYSMERPESREELEEEQALPVARSTVVP